MVALSAISRTRTADADSLAIRKSALGRGTVASDTKGAFSSVLIAMYSGADLMVPKFTMNTDHRREENTFLTYRARRSVRMSVVTERGIHVIEAARVETGSERIDSARCLGRDRRWWVKV